MAIRPPNLPPLEPPGPGDPRDKGGLGFPGLPQSDNMVLGTGVDKKSEYEARNAEVQLQAAPSGSGASTDTASAPKPPKPQPVTPAAPTRMGIGPGGPALGFDEAYSMLNAPANIGQVESAMQQAQKGGKQMFGQFKEQAGDPIAFGAKEKEKLGSYMESGDDLGGAQDVLFRKYGGPLGMGQEREEGEKGLKDVTKAGLLGEHSRSAAEAFGTAGGRAAAYELGGATQGKAEAEAAMKHAQPGYTRGARELAAAGANLQGNLAQMLKQSSEIGEARQVEAGVAGGQARAYLGGEATGLIDAAQGRADKKNIQAGQETDAYLNFVQSGDLSEMAEFVNTGVFEGYTTAQAAKQRWNFHWNKPEYEGVTKYGPLVWEAHYTGRDQLGFSQQTIDLLKDDERFNLLDAVFEQMGTEASGRLRGRWMDDLAEIAATGGRPSQPRPGQGGGMNQIPTYSAAQEAAFEPRRQQARTMLRDVVSPMYTRQMDLHTDFAGAFNPVTTPNAYPGIRSASDIPLEGRQPNTPWLGNMNTRSQGGYQGRYFLSPGEQEEAGKFSAANPLYFGQSNIASLPNLRNQAAGYITPPEGRASWQTEWTEKDKTQYDRAQVALKNIERAVDEGQPFDEHMRTNLDKLITDVETSHDEGTQELSDNTREWRLHIAELRKRYERMLSKASGDIFTSSSSYKAPPTYAPGGIREPIEDEDWEQF